MGEQMVFPETFDEFAEQYKLVDTKQVYTNGTELIPVFRVRQWLMRPDPLAHNIKTAKSEAVKEFAERLKQFLLLNREGEMSVIAFENIDYLVKEMSDDNEI